ncbi:MAG: serine hydrolase [Myxococcota bacterium]
MSKWTRWAAIILGGLGLLCTGGVVAGWSMLTVMVDAVQMTMEEPDWAEIGDADKVLGYLEAHPDTFSLVAYAVDEAGQPMADTLIEYAPDKPLVLASTMKIVVLSALARAIDEGAIDADAPIGLADWDRYYLRGLDGGAHPKAYDLLDVPHDDGRATDTSGQAPARDVARMMIEVSDNAATDVLVTQLGDRMTAETSQVPGHDPIGPIAPVMAHGLTSETPCETPVPPGLTIDNPPLKTISFQRTIAHCLFPRGTAASYTALMAAVGTGQHISAGASQFMTDALDWPMAFEGNQERFATFLTKGGSLPGVLTEASFIGRKNGERWVVALFLNDMSGSAWFALLQSFAQQQFIVKLVEDATFRDEVRRRLMD